MTQFSGGGRVFLLRWLDDRLTRVLDGPYVEFAVGLGVIVGSMFEVMGTIIEEMVGIHLGLQHSMVIVGLFHLAKALHRMRGGLSDVEKARKGA